MRRYVNSRTKGKVLCIPANHPTRRKRTKPQAERRDPAIIAVHPEEEVVGWID